MAPFLKEINEVFSRIILLSQLNTLLNLSLSQMTTARGGGGLASYDRYIADTHVERNKCFPYEANADVWSVFKGGKNSSVYLLLYRFAEILEYLISGVARQKSVPRGRQTGLVNKKEALSFSRGRRASDDTGTFVHVVRLSSLSLSLSLLSLSPLSRSC